MDQEPTHVIHARKPRQNSSKPQDTAMEHGSQHRKQRYLVRNNKNAPAASATKKKQGSMEVN